MYVLEASGGSLPSLTFRPRKIKYTKKCSQLVEDWLLDIVLWYELKQQKLKVISDAGNLCICKFLLCLQCDIHY